MYNAAILSINALAVARVVFSAEDNIFANCSYFSLYSEILVSRVLICGQITAAVKLFILKLKLGTDGFICSNKPSSKGRLMCFLYNFS